MSSQNELLDGIKNLLSKSNKVVSCPSSPVKIPGIVTGAAYLAGDVMGTMVKLAVPKSGIIYSATLWDLDDEGLQYDLEIFKNEITQTADNAPWSPIDGDMQAFVTELAFIAFDDHDNSQTSELTSIGKAYSTSDGYLWIQAIARGAHNIAAGAEPRFQLQIIPDDPEWKEG